MVSNKSTLMAQKNFMKSTIYMGWLGVCIIKLMKISSMGRLYDLSALTLLS